MNLMIENYIYIYIHIYIYNDNSLGKGMHPINLPPSMGK